MESRTIGEPREAHNRITFGRAVVTIRIVTAAGAAVTISIPDALNGEVALDLGDLDIFDDLHDSFRLRPLGSAVTMRDLTLRVRGQAVIEP